ncbi:MAG: peptidase S10 [Planctomycetota bacterium]
MPRFVTVAVWMILLAYPAAAQGDHAKKKDAAKKKGEAKPQAAASDVDASEPVAMPAPVTTAHESRYHSLKYRATAGTLPLQKEDGTKRADVFYVAYERADVTDSTQRPLTFVFNGGPGSSSVWLHLGTVGPRRVQTADDGHPLPPPGRVIDNEETWLDFTDLVFVDPVGTGYSRPAKGHKQKEFSGLKEDTESVGEFIRLYTTRAKRWSSPKFLAGESYGTTRAASLADHLQQRYGFYLSGVVLISSVLNFQTIRADTGNDLPSVLFLPGYTATAFYHGRLEKELQSDLKTTLAQAERFAIETYLPALAKGDTLEASERAAVLKGLARFTGLSETYLAQSNLRVRLSRFAKELLRDQGKTVGRLDSRFLGRDRDHTGGNYEYDPAMAAIRGPFSAALESYIRGELKYECDRTYEIMTGKVHPWSFKSHENRYVNVSENLRRAMVKNRHLKVLVTSGYFDLATPYFAADYTLSHLGLPAALRKNISVRYYEAGHMMYIHTASRQKMRKDVAGFYADASAKREQ